MQGERAARHNAQRCSRVARAPPLLQVNLSHAVHVAAIGISRGAELPDTAEFEVALIDVPDSVGFGRINYQPRLANVTTERRHASHPHPLALGVRYFVPNAFAGDSRSNWAKESKTFSVSRPIEVVVLN